MGEEDGGSGTQELNDSYMDLRSLYQRYIINFFMYAHAHVTSQGNYLTTKLYMEKGIKNKSRKDEKRRKLLGLRTQMCFID